MPTHNKIRSKDEWDNILQDEYVKNKKSFVTIAKEYNCGRTTVFRWLRKCGIETRGTAETQKGVRRPGKHKTSDMKLLRESTAYKEWRLAVYNRDGFKCVGCGDNRGGNLEAHHILSFTGYPKMRFDVSNGATLCKKCHAYMHPNLKFINVA